MNALTEMLKASIRHEKRTRGFDDYMLHELPKTLDSACEWHGCINYRERGQKFCVEHLYGRPRRLPDELAEQKLRYDSCA